MGIEIGLTYKEFRTLIISAFRYALGRKTYIVSDTCDLIINHWEYLSKHEKKLICEEIEHAIEHGMAGMSCDMACWEEVLERGKHDLSKRT